jgi:hypothetical protein
MYANMDINVHHNHRDSQMQTGFICHSLVTVISAYLEDTDNHSNAKCLWNYQK